MLFLQGEMLAAPKTTCSSIIEFYLVTILAFLSFARDVPSAGFLYTGAVFAGFVLTAVIIVLAFGNKS
jgi:hypothetical protein